MNCNDYRDAIAEFVDGSLDAAGRRALERHVEACADCRALVADLKSIQAAAFTLQRHDPPAKVWQAIRARVAAEPVPDARGRVLAWPRTPTAWGLWLAAAAALIVATAVGIYPLLDDRRHQDTTAVTVPADNTDAIASIQAEFEAAEEHYDKAIRGLEQIAKTD